MVRQASGLVIVTVLVCIGLSEAADIPTGCVKLRSYYNNMYLSLSENMYSDNRQHIKMASTETSWTAIKEQNYYRFLKPGTTTHELYVGGVTLDSERRYVFLWKGSNSISESKWIIQKTISGRYLIRSRHLDELMYAGMYGNVYTWQTPVNPYEDEMFHWNIVAC